MDPQSVAHGLRPADGWVIDSDFLCFVSRHLPIQAPCRCTHIIYEGPSSCWYVQASMYTVPRECSVLIVLAQNTPAIVTCVHDGVTCTSKGDSYNSDC